MLEQEQEQERTGLVLGVDKNKIMTFGVHNHKKLFLDRYLLLVAPVEGLGSPLGPLASGGNIF